MTIFKDCYETTFGASVDTKRIVTSLKESMIKDGLGQVSLNVRNDGEFKPVFVTGSSPSENEIPLFAHPISVLNFQHASYVCADLRLFVRKDTPLDKVEDSVKNRTEYNFVKSRAILSLMWQDGQYSKLRTNLAFAGTVYAAWLSESIAKTYGLNFKDQTVLAILSSMFYQSLFSEESTFDEDAKQRMAVHTIKATNAPSELVFQVFDKVSDLSTIESFCSAVSAVTEDVRLRNFNLPVLLTIVKNSWYGTNAKEIISVGLEHPPTWVSVVYTALSERTYKTSMIFRLAERFGKRGAADEFIKNYHMLMAEMTVKAESAPTFKSFD